MKLSIIITAHDEGILLHKTLLSVRRSLSHASFRDYEIIVHVDNSTSVMEKYLNSEAFKSHNVTVYENSFGDVSLARNFCISKTTGHYVFFIDADDLISENFFAVALPLLKRDDSVLIHPEACLSFDDTCEGRNLWFMPSYTDKNAATFMLLEKNLWISSVLGKKSIFENNPYKRIRKGYGNEDYAFNLQTVCNGVSHIVAPETVYFYRKKEVSLLTKANSNNLTQRYTDLFNLDYWRNDIVKAKKISLKEDLSLKDKIRKAGRRAYVAARSNKILNAFITPAATTVKSITGIKLIKPPRIPDAIYEQWKKISSIEPQLYPTKNNISGLTRYDATANNLASGAYLELAQDSTINEADYIFIVPWVTIGGADKVLINYLNALKEIKPRWKIAVITTLPSKNEWANKLPDNACLFDYGNRANDLYNDEERDILLTRLIIQLKGKKVHIINSELGYRWAYAHRQLIEANYDLRLSLFCHDIIPNTKGVGIYDYADPLASRIEPFVSRIFTDNDAVIDRLVKNYGFRREIIKTHFQPFGGNVAAKGKARTDTRMRILWASRICTQKEPELVVKIAKCLDPEKYQIDMYGKMDRQYNKNMFSNIGSLRYCGGFNGLDSIKTDQYDCFLYTSFIDGLPNTILEVASKGLPIIASDAGGIKDFVKNKKTGMLVSSGEVFDYVEALDYIRKNPKEADLLALNAIKLLEKRHNWKTFIEVVKEDF